MPEYLKHDIDEFIKNKDNSKCTVIDCLLDEIYGSINSALWDGEITEEQYRDFQREIVATEYIEELMERN